MNTIKIVLADDHIILRDGLKSVLLTEKNFIIVGEAGDGEEAVNMVKELDPDIVILDIQMPKMNGIESVRTIRKFNKKVKILILTMYEGAKYILDAVSFGVNGYVFKMDDMHELLLGIHKLAVGEDYYGEKVSAILNSENLKRNRNTGTTNIFLTNREKEIVRLIADGHTSQEIAELLFISYFTVGKHRKNILRKLGLKNTAELVSYALKEQI